MRQEKPGINKTENKHKNRNQRKKNDRIAEKKFHQKVDHIE